VVTTFECPSVDYTSGRVAPRSIACDACAWRSQWGEIGASRPAFAAALLTVPHTARARSGRLGAAVRAECDKTAGLYDRLEHSAANEFARMSDEELRAVIVDQAHALEALGVDVPAQTPKASTKKH
jgi:hypothetical protein